MNYHFKLAQALSGYDIYSKVWG